MLQEVNLFGYWNKFFGGGGSAGGGLFVDKATIPADEFDVYRARELAAQAVAVLDREVKDLTFARILLEEAANLIELEEKQN